MTEGSKQSNNIGEIRRVTIVGMIVNILLSALKFTVGILGSSQALIADAVHSLSDLTTDVAVLIGASYWSAPPDDEHPYGHGRIETIVTISIGIVLAAVAAGIGIKGVMSITEKHITQPGLVALTGAVISIIGKELLYHWTLKTGRRIKSSAIIANAWHHRSDAFSSIPVAIAVAVAIIKPAWSVIDHIGAVGVSLFILHAAWKIVAPAFAELTDAGVSSKTRDSILELTNSHPDVLSVHGLRTRKVGASVYVDLHIIVNGEMSVHKGHDVAREVKKLLLKDGPDVIDVIIHVEPDTEQ